MSDQHLRNLLFNCVEWQKSVIVLGGHSASAWNCARFWVQWPTLEQLLKNTNYGWSAG